MECSITEVDTSPHGRLKSCQLQIGPDRNGLQYTLTFALPEAHPTYLWKLSIKNHGPHPLYIERIAFLDTSNRPGSRLRPTHNLQAQAFFSNGWQSWSYTGTYRFSDRQRRTRLGPLTTTIQYNRTTPRPGRSGHLVSDMFGVLVDRTKRQGVLLGFLSQREQFGSLAVNFKGHPPVIRLWAHADGARLDPGESMDSDWACLFTLDIDDPDPLGPYLDAVSREHQLSNFDAPHQAGQAIPTGWCSWYQYFQDVTDEDIRNNLATTTDLQPKISLDIIQIDDGFEAQIGDWLEFSPNFPEGVAPLATEIKEAGFVPGLWLAPFIVHPNSRLVDDHPDWLLRGLLGRPVNAGFVWDTFTTALDLTYPDALAYTEEVVHTAVHKWGYPYLKLDFLYAAALSGRRHDSSRTRAQVLRMGLETIRAVAGEETAILGCGCPLGSAVGLVDAMRIGADVDVRWPPTHNGIRFFFHKEPNLPSARNAIQNTLTRSALHRRWWINDPDCLLLRPETELTFAEVQSLATVIALTGGSLLLSDDLPNLPHERLKIAESLLPVIGKRPHVLDWADSPTPRKLRLDLENKSGKWHLLALFNWEDHAQDIPLRLSNFDLERDHSYLAQDFWAGFDGELTVYKFVDGALPPSHLPAHGVILVAVRHIIDGTPAYIGSDLHISQGLEVTSWETDQDGLQMRIERPGKARGKIALYLPKTPRSALIDGRPGSFEARADNIYHFPVEFSQSVELSLFW